MTDFKEKIRAKESAKNVKLLLNYDLETKNGVKAPSVNTATGIKSPSSKPPTAVWSKLLDYSINQSIPSNQ